MEYNAEALFYKTNEYPLLNRHVMSTPSRTAQLWMLTIPVHQFVPFLPAGVRYIKGQMERGEPSGYVHWQLYCAFISPVRLSGVKSLFGDGMHAEPTRSKAAEDYVWKEETRIEGMKYVF